MLIVRNQNQTVQIDKEMKHEKYLIILIVLFLGACKIKKQSITQPGSEQSKGYTALSKFNGDTLNYLKTNFQNQKEKYIYKPASVLLNDIEFKINSYLFGPGRDASSIYEIDLTGISPAQFGHNINSQIKSVFIYIILEKGPSETEAREMRSKYNGQWTKEVANFYGTYIVKDIKISH